MLFSFPVQGLAATLSFNLTQSISKDKTKNTGLGSSFMFNTVSSESFPNF